MMNNGKEVVSALYLMRSIIQYYLEGKVETEIAALLDIHNSEVTYVLSKEGKETIINHFGLHVWNAIQKQMEQNNDKLMRAYQNDFVNMESDDLRYIINSVLFSENEIDTYCHLMKVNKTLFLLHLLDEDYLISKLGKVKGTAYYQQLNTKIKNVDFRHTEFYHKVVLYLDSLFTKKEFIQYAQLEDSFFQNIENTEIETLIQTHEQQVANIRKPGNLPACHYWVKDPYLRRILANDIFHATPKTISDLHVILAYYTHKGNIDKVTETQKRKKKEVIKIMQSSHQYASLLQPSVLEKIQMHMELQNNHLRKPNFYNCPQNQPVDYAKEVEQKIEWLTAILEVGDIKPYYLCGQLAIHNFSYEKTALALGIDEAQIEMANLLYMQFLTTTSQGMLFPFQYSYSILKYASALYQNQKVKK